MSITSPELSLQWDFEKNEPTTPDSITGQSKTKVWWLCPKSHSFQASIQARVNQRTGCPVCANRQILAGYNDLESLEPKISSEWHPTKNGDLLPSQISRGSEKKVWWKCVSHHEWETSPNHRTSQKTNCPYCSNKKVLSGYNDLKSTHPEVITEWDFTKNISISPDSVSAGSHKKVWWICKAGHGWQAGIVRRTREKTGCPICSSNLILEGVNDLQSSNPDFFKDWDFSRNTNLQPTALGPGSGKQVWWKCAKGHQWKTSPSKRASGQGCPVCIGKKILVGFNDLPTTNPQLAMDWDHERNLPLTVNSVTEMSNKSVWWVCKRNHHWQSVISNRAKSGCPYCGNKTVLSGFNDLQTTNPELAREWNIRRNGELLPTMVVEGSGRKVWWKCKENHEWFTDVSSRTSGRGCPSCAVFGFDPNTPGVLYFIENTKMRARKIGVTNLNNRGDRINDWKKSGWTLLGSFDHPLGQTILTLESRLLRWIRQDLGLPQYLSDSDLKRLGGATETFSGDGVSNQEILDRIRLECLDLGILERKIAN